MKKTVAAVRLLRVVLAGGCVLAGCGAGSGITTAGVTVTPSHASMYGQAPVVLNLTGDVAATVGAVSEVRIGGIHVIDLAPTSTTVYAGTLQGAPTPGPATVELHGASGTVSIAGAFSYDAPSTSVPPRWVAFGASLTQGTESDGIDPHTQRSGVSGLIAQQAGVYLGLPLLTPGLAPPLLPSDFNPDCSEKPGSGAGVGTIEKVLIDPATGAIELGRGRVDPALVPPRDIAIGGSKIADILYGPTGEISAIENIVESPQLVGVENVVAAITISQIDRVEALDPDVGFSTDLLANDLDSSVLGSDLTPGSITPLSSTQPELVIIAARLGKLHGQFFLANLPTLTFLPNVARLAASRVAAGLDTEASFAAKKQAIDDLTTSYNAALAAAMAPYPNLHLVDFSSAVKQLANGVEVDGDELTTNYFGGLISLDGLHFTDTGYALFANLMISRINETLRSTIPYVDIFAVHAADALSPTHLFADGLLCVPSPAATPLPVN